MARKNLQPLGTEQFLVVIAGLTAYFTKCSAPKWVKNEFEYNDGQTGITRTHLGFTKFDKVTLTKHYFIEDSAIVAWAQERRNNGEPFTVTITPVKADAAGSPIDGGKVLTLTDCYLASFKAPEVDRGGTGGAMLELELTVGDFAFS